MNSGAVLYEKNQKVAVITLNRPERLNAINADLLKGLIEYFAAARQDDEVRAVILTGAGRAFCAGEDLTSNKPPPEKVWPSGWKKPTDSRKYSAPCWPWASR